MPARSGVSFREDPLQVVDKLLGDVGFSDALFRRPAAARPLLETHKLPLEPLKQRQRERSRRVQSDLQSDRLRRSRERDLERGGTRRVGRRVREKGGDDR